MQRALWVAALCAASVVGARVVRADIDAKYVVKQQMFALSNGDGAAFASQFGAQSFALLPTATAEAYGKDKIAGIAKAWLGGMQVDNASVDAPTCGALFGGPNGDAVLCTTAMTIETKDHKKLVLRAQLVIASHVDPKTKAQADVIVAEHVSEAVDDKTALALAGAGKLPKLPELYVADDQGDAVDVALDPERLTQQQLGASPGMALLGSSPGELAVGKAAFAAKVKAWKSLKLKTEHFAFGRLSGASGASGTDGASAGAYIVWVASHTNATFTVGGKQVVVPYRALLIYVIAPDGTPLLNGASWSIATH